MITVVDLAAICHEANRAYKNALEESGKGLEHWPALADDHREAIINGVIFHLENPDAGPEASHNNWLKHHRENGWKFAHTLDRDKKTHPCLIPFSMLPVEQQKKDELFKSIVDTFRTQVK